MFKGLLKLAICYLALVVWFALLKFGFYAFNYELFNEYNLKDIFISVIHGLPMDKSVAGYISIIPGLLIAVNCLINKRWIDKALCGYFILVSFLIAIIVCLDASLYSYWGFKIDTTPLFYFSTSPAAAMASITFWQLLGGLIIISVLTFLISWSLISIIRRLHIDKQSFFAFIVLIVVTAGLIIPIRGGFTVATMNLSRVYYSEHKLLNHTSVNPLFSLLYSVTHNRDKFNDFRVMSDQEVNEAISAFEQSICMDISQDADDNINYCVPDSILKTTRPDVYLVILESFSSHLLPAQGGDSIAVGLDSIAQSGVLFTNFYANSFRTDRALPAILSALPAQPSMSILKYVDKAEKLPGIANAMKGLGYDTNYFYGGDVNFANFKAYLIGNGFENIVSDVDFPIAQRTSKWGVHDHLVFNRVIAERGKDKGKTIPQFTVIQTSSSHEPFDVPYSSKRFADDKIKNAFAYTDSCLVDFIDKLKNDGLWDNSLLIIVPDHLGGWPLNLSTISARHHVPLVITGGALRLNGLEISVPGSQVDISPTLLSLLKSDNKEFIFGNNLFDTSLPHFALISDPDVVGLVTANENIEYYIETDNIKSDSIDPSTRRQQIKAYLQKLYQYLSSL